jgi:hypothetical protein
MSDSERRKRRNIKDYVSFVSTLLFTGTFREGTKEPRKEGK